MPDTKISLDEKSAKILSKMDKLQERFNQINKTCRIMRITAVLGAILIMIVLGIFANNFASFIRNYDKKALNYELKDRTLALASSNEVKQLLNSAQDKLLPAYGAALIKEFKESTPLFVKDIQKAKQDIAAHIENRVKSELLNSLINKLSDTEAHVLAEHINNDVSKEKLVNVLDYSTKKFVERLPEILDKRIDPMIVQLDSLNNTFNMVYDDMEKSGEFKEITAGMSGEIENRLIENFLELMIYQINPGKGKKLANQ